MKKRPVKEAAQRQANLLVLTPVSEKDGYTMVRLDRRATILELNCVSGDESLKILLVADVRAASLPIVS